MTVVPQPGVLLLMPGSPGRIMTNAPRGRGRRCRFGPVGAGYELAFEVDPSPALKMKVSKPLEPRNTCNQATAWGASGGVLAVAVLDTPEQLVHGGLTPLQKRARRVAFGKPLARMLVGASRGPLMGKAYARTLHQCGQLIEQVDGKLRTFWCGARWCPACTAIKTARAWNAYGDEVRSWGANLYMVTLTVPNVSEGALRATVKGMHHTFANLGRSLTRQFGKDAVKMIRATECTYSEVRRDFHPHMHIVVHGREVATALLSGWLKRNPKASPRAQDLRKGDSGSVAELFKYATKLSSDKRDVDGSRRVVPAHALDTIFTAFRALRLWQAVGLKAANNDEQAIDDTVDVVTDVGTAATTRKNERITWCWSQAVTDWVDFATGECLTGYEPGRHAKALIRKMEALSEWDLHLGESYGAEAPYFSESLRRQDA
jgi:hypothetical protein